MKSDLNSLSKKQFGFTLIETMIIVAVIGIIAATALPMYQDYTVRTRIVEVVMAGSIVKSTVTENISNNDGAMPVNACIGFTDINTVTNNLVSIRCEAKTGTITILTTPRAGSTTFTLTPITTTEAVSWKCSADIAKYASAGCR